MKKVWVLTRSRNHDGLHNIGPEFQGVYKTKKDAKNSLSYREDKLKFKSDGWGMWTAKDKKFYWTLFESGIRTGEVKDY